MPRMDNIAPSLTQQVLAACKSGDWLDRRRIIAYCVILLIFEIGAFLFFVAGTHGWFVPLDMPVTTDFASFYAAGYLTNDGTPQAAYDIVRHYAAEERLTEPGVGYVIFVYPPVFLLLCALMAKLPYVTAFILFEVGSLAPCVLALKRILKEPGWAVLIPILAFPAVAINAGVGQNAFITAALFGGATLLVDRRPILAGLLFGALCYKPHFGLLVPVALLAGGRWRVAIAAAATVIGLVLVSGTVLGWDAWSAFLTAFTASREVYESGKVDFAAYVSPFGGLRLMGLSPPPAYAIQALMSLTAAGFVALVWRKNLSLPLRAATLAVATLIAIPLALFYDLMLAGVAMAWLVHLGRESGFLPWEKALLIVAFMAPALARGLGMTLHVPFAAFPSIILVGLCAAHARRELGYRAGQRSGLTRPEFA